MTIDTSGVDNAISAFSSAISTRLNNLKTGASETGTFHIDITGNAATAGAFKNAVQLTVSGDATASASFTGASNFTLPLTLAASGVAAGTYNADPATVTSFTVDTKGRITAVGVPHILQPAWANITGKPTTLSGLGVTGVAASGANADITSLNGLTTPLSPSQGGTGLTAFSTGDLLYASGSSALTPLHAQGPGFALISAGFNTPPVYGKVDLTTTVTGVLPLTNGGLGANTVAGAQATLQLVPGTNVQAYSTELTALSGLSGTGYLKRTGQASYAFDTNTYMPVGGGSFTGTITLSPTTGTLATASASQGKLEIVSGAADTDGAFLTFRRMSSNNGQSVYFGLDSDNTLKIGGWSLGAAANTIYHTGNLNISNYLPLTGGYVTGNITLSNNSFIAAKDTVNNVGNILGISASNELEVGGLDTNLSITALSIKAGGETVAIIDANGATFLGSVTAAGFYVDDSTGIQLPPNLGNTALFTLGTTPVNLGATLTNIGGMSSITSTVFIGALAGNANTAAQLQTGRHIQITGDGSYITLFDGSSDVTGNFNLAATGVSAGTYTKVTVDAKGRVTVGDTLLASDIPNLDYSKIVTGKPTTVATSGLTDAVSSSLLGLAGGIATLDSNGLVPASQLPSYVDGLQEAASLSAFPATGNASLIYVAIDTGKTYRWSGSTYVEISPSPGNTDAVPEGSVNKYFTNARAQAAVTTITGNAATSTKWIAPITLSSTGDVTWSGSVDGSGNVTVTSTLATTGISAGTVNNNGTSLTPITYDAKGRITNLGASVPITPPFSAVTGKPTTLAGYGITDAVAVTSNNVPLTYASTTSVTLTTTTSTPGQVLDSFSALSYRSADYVVQTTSGSNYQLTKLLVIHDGTTPSIMEYGDVLTNPGAGALVSFDAVLVSGTLSLTITPVNAATTVRVVRTVLAI